MRADRQTAGYGRRGRAWTSADGNLFATLLWPLAAPMASDGPAGYGFAAALAIRDACIAYGAQPDRLTLKWPNDVLLDGAKLSGLIIELLAHEADQALAIGIGVNLAHAPSVPAYPTAALSFAADGAAPDEFLRSLDDALLKRLSQWQEDGFGAIRDAWLDSAAGIGQPITVRLPNKVLSGTFGSIDRSGALLLETSGGTITVTAGDVFFPAGTG